MRRASASVTSFSRVPFAPVAPVSSPPWPGSRTIVRRPGIVAGSIGAGSGVAALVGGGAASVAPSTSITRRDVAGSIGMSAARKLPNRGPSSIAIDGCPWTARTACTHPSEANVGTVASIASAPSKRTTRRPGSCTTVCGVGGAMSSTMRAPLPGSSRWMTTRGTRRLPAISSRDPLRRSSLVSVMSASARGMNSIGYVPPSADRGLAPRGGRPAGPQPRQSTDPA